MNAAVVFSAILRVVGPELEDVHAHLVADLENGPRCDRPVLEQPYDCPERARFALAAIADRETGRYAAHIRWFGRHPYDARFDHGLWRLGLRRGQQGRTTGALASWCPAHDSHVGMSTSGPHGQIYLYNVHRIGVPGNCVPWWLFASSLVSGIAALDRYLDLCDRPDDPSWCPTKAATRRALRRRCAHNDFTGPACREV